MKLTRRTLLKGTMGLPLAGAAARTAWADDDLDDADLGVASGDPWPDGFVIWTRLPRSLRTASDVRWEVATSPDFGAAVVASGALEATAARDFCVKIRVGGLEPFAAYFYRFMADAGFATAVGRARTAPVAGTAPPERKIGVVNCQ